MSMDFRSELLACQEQVEAALQDYFAEPLPQQRLLDAMRYSLLAGGKRIRPVLALKFCEAAGGDPQQALPVACAVEMLHTYSLIHDDLPCMDNDDLRRGKPTNHKMFGEMTAVLAGDSLQTAAFEAILASTLPAEARAACALTLAKAAGAEGMCGGQQLDMEGETRAYTLEEITRMNDLKTGCLLQAACEMGVLAAGVPEGDPRLEAARAYAQAIGLAFQIQDDILNVTSTAEEMGKPVGNDVAMCKSTYVSLLGVETCRKRVETLSAAAKTAVVHTFPNSHFLLELADYLAQRKN
jgi:geranylgeranyl diphosphate synthase type II